MQLTLEGIGKRVGAQSWLYEMSLTPHPGAVTVLLGFAFVALIGCETLRGRSFWKRKA